MVPNQSPLDSAYGIKRCCCSLVSALHCQISSSLRRSEQYHQFSPIFSLNSKSKSKSNDHEARLAFVAAAIAAPTIKEEISDTLVPLALPLGVYPSHVSIKINIFDDKQAPTNMACPVPRRANVREAFPSVKAVLRTEQLYKLCSQGSEPNNGCCSGLISRPLLEYGRYCRAS